MAANSRFKDVLARLDLSEEEQGATDGTEWFGSGDVLEVRTPIDGSVIARVRQATEEDYERVVETAQKQFLTWRTVPAPKRGEIIRQMNVAFREKKDDLAALVTLEMGKVLMEGEGEVQEVIDVADYAVGLSRQLYGLTIASERPGHRMFEQWHPLGPVAVVTAFNFPVAVWSWNSMIGGVCGDTIIWKPSSKTPLTAIAMQKIANKVLADNGYPGVFTLVVGPGRSVGDRMINDKRIPLVSATGSCSMGYKVYEAVAKRMGRAILELGGNNAIVVTESADLDLATRAIVFGAVGTAGQRCTSTRRIIVHESVREELERRLVGAYKQLRIGDPLDRKSHVGPVVEETAITAMQEAMEAAKKEGGTVLVGGERLKEIGSHYVRPAIMRVPATARVTHEETFAPLLYVIPYAGDVHQAIAINNEVPQGLSSAIFTTDLRESEAFLSAAGSDCGIANVNIGTSGAEIGGAFGGEKETGGGRESGSDSWKQYMRRQTNTINYSRELPLAQGIEFNLD